MHNTELTVASGNGNFLTIPSTLHMEKTLWWEEPLDEFVEMLQELHRKHDPYFSAHEMESIYNEVYHYTYQRGKLWEDQIARGVSTEYMQYLADDLVGYLRHIYRFLKEDIMDRRRPASKEDIEAPVIEEISL